MPEPIDKRFRRWSNQLISLKMELERLELDDYGISSNFPSGDGGHGGDHSDPTQRAAMARLAGNKATNRAQAALEDLVKDVGKRVDKFLTRNKWVTEGGIIEAPDVWCESHERHNVFVPRYRGSLCRRCYDYSLANDKQWPPRALVELWESGKRVTAADLEAVGA